MLLNVMLVRSLLPHKPTIYFAGKIARHDWRGEILGDRAGGEDYTASSPLWDPAHTRDCETFLYGGPFFASCDHGCGHRLNAHGSNSCGPDDETHELHRKVWTVNYARVRRADIVFAYVNEADCFGTMIEVGIAAAVAKPLFLAFGPNLTERQRADLWMLTMPAVQIYHGPSGVAWRAARSDLGLDPYSHRKLPRPAAV